MTTIFLASGALALGSFVVPFWGLRGYDTEWLVPYGVSLTVAWAGLIVFGFIRYGRRGTWMLIEAPLALYWPLRFIEAMRHFPVS
jgi:hypothetical protein